MHNSLFPHVNWEKGADNVNIFFYSAVCFFAILGALQILKNITDMIFGSGSELLIVVTVKNQQDKIEGIIRSIAWKSLNGLGHSCVPTILIVDLESTDETPEILKRLSRDYEFIKVTNRQGYIDLLTKD